MKSTPKLKLITKHLKPKSFEVNLNSEFVLTLENGKVIKREDTESLWDSIDGSRFYIGLRYKKDHRYEIDLVGREHILVVESVRFTPKAKLPRKAKKQAGAAYREQYLMHKPKKLIPIPAELLDAMQGEPYDDLYVQQYFVEEGTPMPEMAPEKTPEIMELKMAPEKMTSEETDELDKLWGSIFGFDAKESTPMSVRPTRKIKHSGFSTKDHEDDPLPF